MAAGAGRVSADDINKLRDASELARRVFKEHKMMHDPKPRVSATEAARAAENRHRQTTAIPLPS
jgi:methionine aminopeptidase